MLSFEMTFIINGIIEIIGTNVNEILSMNSRERQESFTENLATESSKMKEKLRI